MKTVLIYLDNSKRNVQKVTPANQDAKSEHHFDGNWLKLVQQITGGNYYKFEVIG